MNYGLYISTSGALNATYIQDLHTSNLANVNTVGFKPEAVATMQRDPARLEDGLGHLPSNELLEMLSAGVRSSRTRTNFAQGVVRTTGNPLDLAIRGDGFFTLLDEQDKGLQRYRLTRDGRFTLDAQGRMVSVTSGMPLVDPTGRPIRLTDPSQVTVRPDGVIIQNDVEVATVGLVEIPNRDVLQKGPDGYFVPDVSQMANRKQARGEVVAKAIEESAINEIATLMKIESAARSAQANLGMIGYHDRILDQAINRFARVA